MWRFPNGVERLWARPEPVTSEQEAWAAVFHSYKVAQAQLRRQLWDAVSTEDFAKADALQTAIAEGGASLPAGATLQRQLRLQAGRQLVPGVCFVHRRDGYRGVIIGCEPWCNAPAAWRSSMNVAELPRGEQQPFYNCLVDLDDGHGQTAFVAEEDMEPTTDAYPIKSPFATTLLVECDEIQGYLVLPRLEEARLQQQEGGQFSLSPTWRHRRAHELVQREQQEVGLMGRRSSERGPEEVS
jgi:hemimethylated DNA binding protein